MHSVLAIARVTLKDALRKRVFFTVLFFAAVLTVASGLLPWVTPGEQIRQVAKICLAGISFFGMIVAIFVSAPNLPDDISAKTIFTVMTKPARRWHILAGKILGLAYVLAILVLVMGALSFAYIHFWAWKIGPDKSGQPRLEGNRVNYARSVNYHGLKLDVSRPMIESRRAIVSGLDRITYHFQGLGGERFSGDTVFARVALFSHGFSLDPATKQGTAALEVTNPTTRETDTIIFSDEKVLGFPRSLIDKSGALDITVVRHLPSGSYSATASSITVLSQPSGYAANFLKALVMMFVQYMVLVFLATAASTFLTSTVSIITALFIYFTGSLVEVLRTQALTLAVGSDIFTMAQHTHAPTQQAVAGVDWFVNVLLRYFYLGISIFFPDLDYYNMSAAVSQNEYISNAAVGYGLLYGALYAAGAFAVAWLVFRHKEVA